ncbi:kinesin [Microthyrium microscopicum]|uniref:Kinesin n=1 Tax=Microthyrium microscopicum TaxID=703497 RepID=A0A6A6UPU9_9PEZI|nr:kinesin [Microthyrium microscopicum]
MDSSTRSSPNLFDVYLRLRPSLNGNPDRFLDVEPPEPNEWPRYITIKPPVNDHRKRAVEKFAFTRVFEEDASQLDLFQGTGILSLLEGVLGAEGRPRDGLLATLGVTGSGKSHTILGTKSQRGLTQLALDVLFQSISHNLVHPTCINSVLSSIAVSDVSDAHMQTAALFLDSMYGDGQSTRGSCSRAQTPMPDASYLSVHMPSKQKLPRPSMMAQSPNVDGFQVPVDPAAEYVIVVSMYEVYNDKIYDLLVSSVSQAKRGFPKRPSVPFKSTEKSSARKVVAGLRKIVCSSLDEALQILETGLVERKVAGTGSNAVSSRSHGFFCVEVKKRNRIEKGRWEGQTLTIVDLAGSERARQANTAGATLVEAGKINESLMYLGQCMQMMQSGTSEGQKANIVPYRQCKLTEVLFSNSFPSAHIVAQQHHHHNHYYYQHRHPQKAIMVVAGDATGDFNATSQMLRYSALAREVTIPRIPSITSQILSGGHGNTTRPGTRDGPSGRDTPSAAYLEEMELKDAEIARLNDELDILTLQLDDQRARREDAETCWAASEERMAALEQEIRDECYEEMQNQIETERRRWKAALDAEADYNDERLDAKIDIMTREVEVYEDEDAKVTVTNDNSAETKLKEAEEENRRLLARIEMLERENMLKTPTKMIKKQRVLKAKKWEAENVGLESP